MKDTKTAKKQLLGCRQSRTIDAKLAKILPGYEAEESFEAKAVAVERERHEDAFNAIAGARQKDAKYYRNELDKVDLEKATAVLMVEELQGEVNSLGVEINSLKAQRDRAQKEAKNLAKKLTTGQVVENARLAELFRDHLDDSADDMENDNEWEREARQLTWNTVDAEASKMSDT